MLSRRAILLTCLITVAGGLPAVGPAEAQSSRPSSARQIQADRAASDARVGQMTERALEFFHAGKYRETIAILDERATVTSEDQGMGLIRAWSLYHLNRYDQALNLFTQLDRRESTRDTQYGVYYSRRRLDPAAIGD
jgi:hypothetical protein